MRTSRRSTTPTPQRVLALLAELTAVVQALATTPEPTSVRATQSGMRGIYPHRSKYNPWRAYIWDPSLKRAVYLGAFPSIAKARAARKAYREGSPVAAGNQVIRFARRQA